MVSAVPDTALCQAVPSCRATSSSSRMSTSANRKENARPIVFARVSPPDGSVICHARSQMSPRNRFSGWAPAAVEYSCDPAKLRAVMAVAGRRAVCRYQFSHSSRVAFMPSRKGSGTAPIINPKVPCGPNMWPAAPRPYSSEPSSRFVPAPLIVSRTPSYSSSVNGAVTRSAPNPTTSPVTLAPCMKMSPTRSAPPVTRSTPLSHADSIRLRRLTATPARLAACSR